MQPRSQRRRQSLERPRRTKAIAAALSAGLVIAYLSPGMASRPAADTPFHELVLVLGFVALPFIGFAATKIGHGIMVNRYVLPALLGMAMACGYLLQWSGRKSLAVFAVFVLSVVAFQERPFWVTHRGHLTAIQSPAEDLERILNGLPGYRDLPVVMSDGTDYLAIAHYALPGQARRYVSVVDPAAALTYQGSDILDKSLLVLRSYWPLQVHDFPTFAAEHRRFLLYSRGGMFDWWPARLAREGYALRAVVAEPGVKIYLVDVGVVCP